MASVRARDTKPEMIVRSLLHRSGFRYRLHRVELPGSPDIVLPKHNCVILVHGRFWHQHSNCSKSKRPITNTQFWTKKLDDNMRRDERNTKLLEERGWRVIVVWECETRDHGRLASRLTEELGQHAKT